MSHPLTITILQGAFFPVPPVRGGAVEKLWHQLGVEFARRGHCVTHLSRAIPELPETEECDGVSHVRVPGYDQPTGSLLLKFRDLRYTRRALRRAPAADILVTNTFFAPLLAPARLGKLYVSVERMPKGQMRLYRRAARLRACSQAVGDAIVREAPGLAPRVAVIPNPLPFIPTTPSPTPEEKHGLLYVGRIHPAKGLEFLLTAYVSAKKQGLVPPDCLLTLVGPAEPERGGGGESWWRGLLARHADPSIRWLGSIYDPVALNDLYRAARGFVYPTIDEAGEAMPIAPLEAMAWGCVPVVSDLACFRDYIHDGINGIVFNHRSAERINALATALGAAHAPASRDLGLTASRVRETHSSARIADAFLADFSCLLQRV